MSSTMLEEGDALLIVDVQNDFCPGGALAIPEGDQVVPVLNDWLAAAARVGTPVYASRDWHPLGHGSFAPEGGKWPPHCLIGTEGAAFHPGLRLPNDVVEVIKGTRFDQDQYSAFDQTGLHDRLRKDGIRRLWVGGLALDVCVTASVLDGREYGFDVHLIPGGSRAVDAEGGRKAMGRMTEAGVVIGEEGL